MIEDHDSNDASILLISERDERCRTTRATLARLGCGLNLAWARTAAEASRWLAGGRVQLVLVDIEFDEGRGRSLQRHLARHHSDAVFFTLCDAAAVRADRCAQRGDMTWDLLDQLLKPGLAAAPGAAETAALALHQAAPHTPDEAERQRTLLALEVLDTSTDPTLDALVRVASRALDCPIALISLVDAERQWFKSSCGLELRETPREVSFCAHAILGTAPLVVEDASRDPRFARNPLVTGPPYITFYAGVPLVIDGHALGTLCVIDRRPRQLTAEQQLLLVDLARSAQHWLESRRTQQLLKGTVHLPGGDGQVLQGVMIDAAERRTDFAEAGVPARPWNQDHDAQLRRLSAAVEQASEAICITDLDGCIEYVNQAACDSSGYAAEELIGRNASIFKSGHTPAEDHRALWQSLKSGVTWRGVLFNRRKDGRVYVETATITPVRDAGGRIDGYLAVKEDVSEKRRMSDELDEYRQRLDEMVDQRTTELQRARVVAEAASTAKSAFLAAMSHEIRTPMNGVIGILDVLQRSSLSAYQRELTDTIGESATALLRVIDDILDFSKIEAGRLSLERATFDLEQLVDSTCDTLHPLAAARGIELRWFVDPALPPQCVGDAYRLRQVLLNLVGNAVKFSAGVPRRGRVSLRVQPGQDGRIAFVVRDNGIGMADEVRERLFQPFAQGESSTTRSYGGTGLGLVISQRLAQAMGGRIVCSSRPGAGSVFQFELALHDDAAGIGHLSRPGATASLGTAPAQPLSGLRCLLLLDDAELAADWTAYLGAAGAEVSSLPASTVAETWPPGGEGERRNDENTPSTVLLSTTQQLEMATGPLPPTVQVQSGQRRAPRIDDAGHVLLDSDGLHRSTLVHAVAIAARRDVAPPPAAPTTDGLQVVPEDLETAASRGRVVLVAEDNEVNREVVAHQLRLLGLACELVADGTEALERLRTAPQRYGLLLTDLHMPRLDGYDLAAAIRFGEAGGTSAAGQHRLTIVALTANALRGEAERCLALGFDDYLCKPIRLEALRQTLARWLPVAVAAPAQPPADEGTTDANTEPDFADSALDELLGSDADRLASVRRAYLSSIEQSDGELRRALDRNDWPTMAAVAHRLKSSSRWVGALAIARKFEALERAGLGSDAPTISALAADLVEAFAAAREHFEALGSGTIDGSKLPAAIASGEPARSGWRGCR